MKGKEQLTMEHGEVLLKYSKQGIKHKYWCWGVRVTGTVSPNNFKIDYQCWWLVPHSTAQHRLHSTNLLTRLSGNFLLHQTTMESILINGIMSSKKGFQMLWASWSIVWTAKIGEQAKNLFSLWNHRNPTKNLEILLQMIFYPCSPPFVCCPKIRSEFNHFMDLIIRKELLCNFNINYHIIIKI